MAKTKTPMKQMKLAQKPMIFVHGIVANILKLITTRRKSSKVCPTTSALNCGKAHRANIQTTIKAILQA